MVLFPHNVKQIKGFTDGNGDVDGTCKRIQGSVSKQFNIRIMNVAVHTHAGPLLPSGPATLNYIISEAGYLPTHPHQLPVRSCGRGSACCSSFPLITLISEAGYLPTHPHQLPVRSCGRGSACYSSFPLIALISEAGYLPTHPHQLRQVLW